MKKRNIATVIAGLIAVTSLLGACGGTSDNKGSAQSGVEKVKVAYDQASKPMTYTDEKGNATGYDVEVMKLVDEKLTDYSFDYVGTTSDDLLIGVEQGKFQVGVKNAFVTEERKQKFLFPKNFLGLSSIGLVLKTENEAINTLEKFATKGYSLAPIAANNAQYTVVKDYNDEHPKNNVKLKAGDSFEVDVIQWVNEGRSDGGVMIEGAFEQAVVSEKGAYHNLKDNVVYKEFGVMKTWPLFNKKQQKLADEYDKAVQELRDEGKLAELSKEFYGKDLFNVLDQAKK
ncbi:transporter substrate-binding domain-containing protein [Kurthia sibirica]|uniref:Amino acid ABC transporter substrate-binding protein n=1 Tax=Kurthia sibirica TaxID=202750 RepID=A0A2U3AJN3_9BACL|nr:transporter substrate-binding domain-containing protein [Kurthia sibirica]PWI24732.1 amino acid ABC transporter substrate-binding protein [Kurthia sibirica]GEK34762.1 L-cystine-binding protein TcyK [Kurthia sibirica]